MAIAARSVGAIPRRVRRIQNGESAVNRCMDETDLQLLGERLSKFMARQGPRTGDFVKMPSGNVMRLGNDTSEHFQIAEKAAVWEPASFYLSHNGSMTYTGPVYKRIYKAELVQTPSFRRGFCWFYHHDVPMRDKVSATIMARVFEYRPRS